jgi:hypothetical protein
MIPAALLRSFAEDHELLSLIGQAPRFRQGCQIGKRLVAQGGLKDPPWRWRPSSGIRFDSQVVIHCDPELLLASKVALRRLDGDVAK